MAFSISRPAQNQPKTTAADFFSTLLEAVQERAYPPLDLIPDDAHGGQRLARVNFEMPIETPAQRERFQHILGEVQQVETPRVPRGVAALDPA